MDLSILSDKEQILDRIVEKLARTPVDYTDKINAFQGRGDDWRAAGVIVLLFYRETGETQKGRSGEFVVQLIKRSASVPQPGDLSCPGGMFHPLVDSLFSPLVSTGLLPIMRGKPRAYAKKRPADVFRTLSLFLINALREAWEETGLNPLNVRFLGALPSNDLVVFRRSIFPLVGHVKNPWVCRPNWEVEKIVEIPLRDFFLAENYGTVAVETFVPLRGPIERIRDFPCLIYRDPTGGSEILWGATMNILLNFIRTVFEFEPPLYGTAKVIHKSLFENYVTGNARKA
ncbi:MAG TPA: CoA pyrophosphatase [Syntrophales bacterium]|jgi:8-oxo-dGTP pyrophosphatase MutT (NUDIX family)|nr:CoA pyrophosphatase [Syntrophales bacterium]HRT61360.1 CoA pyrophosphatase [Syntrophales bacterium]